MTCHSEIVPALSTFCLLLLRLQAHCLPPLDVLDYLDLLHQHNLSWAARRTCVCGWSQGAPQPSLGGVHPHLQSLYLQLALSDIMSLLLNNSFWAKTVTYSVELLHVHGLLLHASHLLPLQYGSGTVHIHNTEQLLLATDCGILHGLSHVCHQHLLGPHRHQVVHHYLFVPLCTGIYFTSFFLPLLLGTRTFLILAESLEPSHTPITFVIISMRMGTMTSCSSTAMMSLLSHKAVVGQRL